jgi:carbamoyl-phosphate synthase large subunit
LNNAINILFLGGAKRVSLGEHFIEWGVQNKQEVRLFSYELNAEVPICEIATIIEGLKWSDPELLFHLKNTIETNNIDIVIPFLDPATLAAARLQEAIPSLYIPTSSHEICSIFFNKTKATEWCLKNEIPIPGMDRTKFPLIAKPVAGSASKDIHFLHDQIQLDSFINTHIETEYLIQHFIKANEYTVDAFRSISHGNIGYLVPRIRLEVQGGEAIKTRTVRHPGIEALSRKIIDKSGLMGSITLQFLEEEKTGKLYFMEVNPRFGGGVITCKGAGIEIANHVIQDMNKVKCDEITTWESGMLMMRRFKEIYIHANHH